jgi:WD40 repeat protein
MACAAGNGLVIPQPNYMTRTLTIATLHSPWKSLEPAAIESPSHVTAAVCDTAANRIAFAAGDRVRIWDITNGAWQQLLDIPETDLAIGAAISPDGKLLAHASRNEIVFTEIPTSRRLFTIGPRGQRQMAFHPSNEWLAAAGNTLGVVSINDENHLREIYVGGKSKTAEFARAAMRKQLQKIDLDKFEKEKTSIFDKQMRLLESRMGKAGMSKDALDKAREMMEKSVQTYADHIKAAKTGDDSGIPAVPATANELVMCVGFTSDGRWLYCGTNAGLRVYDWQTFPRETGSDAPAPAWQFSPPGSGERDHNRQINAVVEDPDGKGLVFAGWSGDLFRLDLTTGEVRKLISIPGGGGVWSLALSKSGEVLAVSSQFSGRLSKQTLLPDSRAFEVWDLKRLSELPPSPATD